MSNETKSLSRKQRTQRALEILREAIPSPETELEFENPYQLLVAVVLSAQCTDARVNQVTPAFYERFPTVDALAAAEPEQVYEVIRSISYPNQKAKHLVLAARMIVEEHAGEIPSDLDVLVKLPGVGRKTAQVIASVAYQIPALPVDTHVFRVANRIGMVKDANTPMKVELQLKESIPREDWGIAHHLLILHGRYTCKARNPACERCPVAPYCLYYQGLYKG